MVKQIESKYAFQEALNRAGEKLVVVDISATWCGPCKMIKPFFLSLSEKYSKVVFLEKGRIKYEDYIPICHLIKRTGFLTTSQYGSSNCLVLACEDIQLPLGKMIYLVMPYWVENKGKILVCFSPALTDFSAVLTKELLVLPLASELGPGPGYLEKDALYPIPQYTRAMFIHKTPPSPRGTNTSPRHSTELKVGSVIPIPVIPIPFSILLVSFGSPTPTKHTPLPITTGEAFCVLVTKIQRKDSTESFQPKDSTKLGCPQHELMSLNISRLNEQGFEDRDDIRGAPTQTQPDFQFQPWPKFEALLQDFRQHHASNSLQAYNPLPRGWKPKVVQFHSTIEARKAFLRNSSCPEESHWPTRFSLKRTELRLSSESVHGIVET
eukprot:bmy_08565T0